MSCATCGRCSTARSRCRSATCARATGITPTSARRAPRSSGHAARSVRRDAAPARRSRVERVISTPQKIVCVGLNYRDHAEEQGVDLPERPLLFAKWPNTLIASGDPIRIPPISQKVDYEAELGVVIGRRTAGVSVDDALEFVEGYVGANGGSGLDL